MFKSTAGTWMLSASVAILLGAALMSAAGSALHQARVVSAIASGEIKLVKLEPVVISGAIPKRKAAAAKSAL